MINIIKYLDTSHLLDKIRRIPTSLITEIIILLLTINYLFAIVYYQIYKNDKTSFKNIHNLESKKDLELFDFLYFSSTSFFSLGYDLIPQSKLARIICMLQLKIAFIITTIYIAKIINH